MTFKVPPNIIPTIKKTGFNNLVGKIISYLVKAKHRFRPNEPSSQGSGKPIKVPMYPPTIPINKAL